MPDQKSLSSSPNKNEETSPTARPTPDTLGIGRTSGQRGAEILAGVRHILNDTPETKALRRFGGEIAARIFMRVVNQPPIVNYPSIRERILQQLIEERLASKIENDDNPVLIELAAGLSARGILMAKKYPQLQVYEIDLPDVVRDKQHRLKQAGDVDIPENLSFHAVDLGNAVLADLIDTRADIVCSEGLLSYFDFDTMVHIAQQAHTILKPNGIYMADVTHRQGILAAGEASRLFSRQAGQYRGLVSSQDEAESIFQKAGFASQEVYRVPELAQQMHKTLNIEPDVHDFAFIHLARKAE